MISEKRRIEIITLLKQNGYCTVEELARHVYVSIPTIRRNLTQLEKEGILKRVHGGASYISDEKRVLSFDLRKKEMLDEKIRIGESASKLLSNDDYIFMDSSSTCLCLAQAIVNQLDLSIMTNSIEITHALSINPKNSIELTGGIYHRKGASLCGQDAQCSISKRYAKYCFISCNGIDKEFGISSHTNADIGVKREYAKQSEKVVLLVDSSKFDQKCNYKLFDFNEIDIIVTDKKLNEQYLKICEHYEIQVIVKEK